MNKPPLVQIPSLRSRNPEWWEGIMRLFNVQGPLPDSIEARINASLNLANLDAPEYRWLKRWRTYETGNLVQAVAAQRAGLSLTLTAANAATLVVIERIWMQALAANGNWAVSIRGAATFGGTARISVVDGRMETTPSPMLALNVGTSAAAFPLVPNGPLYAGPINALLQVVGPWVLVSTGGAQTFQVETDLINTACVIGARWYERTIQGSEF